MSSPNGAQFGRVFDGTTFQNVPDPHLHLEGVGIDAEVAVPPTIPNGVDKSSIFVSIPHLRDGKRCAVTLKQLFERAAHPERVTVGIIEQTDTAHPEDDPTCVEEYCRLLGHKMGEHLPGYIHKGEKEADRDAVKAACPYTENIRTVRFFHMAAKGPVYARSFIRKVLGNEDFCMAINAATDFAEGWDDLATTEWVAAHNEYAVLSTVPLTVKERAHHDISFKGSPNEVPRQCKVKIGPERVPLYEKLTDGKAVGLTQPLLSRAHSPSFAFAKCHYETNVPHDPFAAQLDEAEQFPHYARLWTRGYDVYTPSRNLVYRDNATPHPLHRGGLEDGDEVQRHWKMNSDERRDAFHRMKTMLDVHHGGDVDPTSYSGKGASARANLGIYGLGQRRTLRQLEDFVGIALPGSSAADGEAAGHGNDGSGCADLTWVPYDASVGPRANLYDGTGKADDLDPDPEFALRTLPDATGGQYDHPFPMGNAAWAIGSVGAGGARPSSSSSSGTPYGVIFALWLLGLFVWYSVFLGGGKGGQSASSSTRRSRRKKAVRPASELPYKSI